MEATDDDESLRDAHVREQLFDIRALELQWNSLGDGPDDEEDPFELCTRVLWLQRNEAAADSFVILADLAETLARHEHVLGGPNNRWHESIVHRGARMLERAWPEDRVGTVPWVVGDNRPALGLLADYIDLLDDGDDEFEDMLVLYLRLNPDDNHACRSDLMNLWLRGGRDAEALEFAERYPKDFLVETRYGMGLALYRLGREAEAVNALNGAVERIPLVLKYLIRNRIEQPPPDEGGLLIGGDYQAWIYRDAMRETWLAKAGMRDWLKQFIPRGKAALREKKQRQRRARRGR